MKRLMSLLALVMCFAMSQAVTVSFSTGDSGAEGTAPSSLSDDSSVSIPANFTLYLEGYTLTGWTDGTTTYAAGDALTEDASLTPVFTENSVTLDDRTEDVTFTFDFQTKNGAPTLSYQGSTGIYVTQATVAGETIDVKMDFDTSNGKLNNTSWTDWAQVNSGTIFTVPSCYGATFELEAYSTISTTTIGGSTNYTSGTTITYQTASTDETIEIVIGDGSYYRTIAVTFPYGDVEVEETETYTITYALEDSDVEGSLATTSTTAESGQSVTLPKNFTMYKEGYTLTGWSDGTTTYATGEEYYPTADVTLTAVFTENSVTLDDRTESVTLYWTFRSDEGAPSLSYQGSTGIYVCQATVEGETIDVKMDFDTSSGKLNNTSWTDWAQVNSGTIFTIPSCKGAVVSMEAYSSISTTTIDGDDDYTSGTTISYTVYSTTETIEIVIGDGSYYRYIQTVLPVVETSSAGTVYEDEAATVYWPFNSSSDYESYTATPSDGFSAVSVDIGDATITGTGTRTADDEISGVTFVKLQPATGGTDEVSWYVKPAAGLTFTPTVLSAYIQRFGTDSSSGVTVYATVDGTKTALGTYTAPRANKTVDDDKYGTNSDYTHQFVIELTEDQQEALSSTEGFTLSATIGVGSTKEGGFSQVTIEGLLNGTIEDVESYTFSAVCSPEEAGEVSISPKGTEFDEGTEIKVSVEKNFGYEFVNWTDDEDNVVSESKTFVYTIEKDVVLTANFNVLETYELDYSVDGGANLYMVELTPEPEEVDDKYMYEEGTEVTAAASSNAILTFTNWSDGQTSSEITFTMTEDKTLVAYYSAVDFIAGWDFYTSNNGGRVADFAAEDNDADALVLRDEDGNTVTWLDKSEEGAGGYEGRPAAVNWQSSVAIGTYYWQTKVNATAFTDIKVTSAMLYAYNAYTVYNVEYSLDNENWTTIGQHSMTGSKVWDDEEFELPSDADNQEAVYIRWKADTSSDVDGTSSSNDGIAISGIYITGTAALVDDGTAPVLVSSVPEEGSSTASANGKIVLTFDEKVIVDDDAEATLGDLTLTPTVSGKTVMFTYKGLDYNTEYTFTLPANSIADRTYNYYTEDIVINFSTRNRDAVTKKLYDFIVPDDGTFKEAVSAAADRDDTSVRYRIFVKKGYYLLPYDENTLITNGDYSYPSPITYLTTPYVSIIGEDMDETIIENDMYEKTESGTSYPIEGLHNVTTLSLQSAAKNTYIQDITLWNGMNDNTGRGEALGDYSDKTICKDVYLHGYQDTYCSNSASRYYFEGGVLRGRTDYLCGKGDIFFNGVELRICASGGYVCAPSSPKQYGYIFSDCTITGEVSGITGNYTLGRPWGSGTPIALYINTVCDVVPSDAGWSEMSGGYPARMAEYNSVTSSGTVIDLSNRKTTFGDGYTNDPVLTEEEAALYTIETVMGSDDEWDPTYYTEQASAPENVTLDGTTLTWDDNDYILLWAVCKDGDVVDFTIEPTYTIDDTDATWSVRAANEMGGLGDATEAVAAGESAISEVSFDANSVVSTQYYNMQGVRVDDSYHGAVIRVETTADGVQTATKVVK